MSLQVENMNKNTAKDSEQQGEDCLKTSCIFCKFKPNYLDAIPFFQKASDSYHGSKDWQNEIKSRINLTKCFRETNSHWEEGNEYEKIAKIRLNQLSLSDEAMLDIQNAHNAYFTQREYESSIKCLVTLSEDYTQRSEFDYAERCLKTAYEAIQKIFHVVCMKKDTEPISYVYKCIEAYIDVLIRNNKEESSAEILNNMVKLIRDEDADNKEQIEKFYVILLGVYIILGEEKNFNDLVEIVEGGSNLRMIQKIKKSINDKDEKDFKNNLDDAEYVLPGQMCKKIRGIFKSSLPKQEDMIIQTNDIKLNAEDTDSDLR